MASISPTDPGIAQTVAVATALLEAAEDASSTPPADDAAPKKKRARKRG